MENLTIDRLGRYLERVIEMNEIAPGADPFITAARNFNVAPSIQQILIDKLTEGTSILSRFNVVLVTELVGAKLGLGIDGKVIASRTNTSGVGRRKAIDPSNLDEDSYACFQTNFDTKLRYDKLDLWAKFADFEVRIANQILAAQRRDRLRIGFNGITAAGDTDRVANPLGQDVNVGWLQRMRLNAEQNVIDSGAQPDKITYGAAGDYKTLDALVVAMINELIDPWHQNGTDLVCLIGRNLLQDKYFPLVNAQRDPSEQLAADVILSSRRVGGLPAFQIPDFPADTLAVTSFDNLSIYEQEGKRRRAFRDEPDQDAYINWESFNEGFVVEDYGKMAVAERIEEKAE